MLPFLSPSEKHPTWSPEAQAATQPQRGTTSTKQLNIRSLRLLYLQMHDYGAVFVGVQKGIFEVGCNFTHSAM
jgi:hypothetical protein